MAGGLASPALLPPHFLLCAPSSPIKSEFIRAKYQMLAFVHKLPCRDDDGVTAKDLSKVRGAPWGADGQISPPVTHHTPRASPSPLSPWPQRQLARLGKNKGPEGDEVAWRSGCTWPRGQGPSASKWTQQG